MELILTGIFWLIIILLVHTYIIYPVILGFISLFKGKPYPDVNPRSLPSVSILISAYNEEKVIEDRIENIKNLNYNFNKVELIIGSDCSSDKTEEILSKKGIEHSWIKVSNYKNRRGKAAVLNDLADLAKNEILVFTDANTRFEQDALLKLVSQFSSQKIGGVCGKLILEEPKDDYDSTNKERLYWKYETKLKELEGRLGLLISANGGIYAIRKKLFQKFPDEYAVTDDLYQTLAVLNQNFDFIYRMQAVAHEDISKEVISEFRRKVRFAATNYQTILFFKRLLFNKRIFLSFALWSHKILRWLVPVIAILLFITSLLLVNSGQIYFIVSIIQACFYFSALIGFLFHKLKLNGSVFSIIYYYTLTNLALLVGMFKFLAGKHTYTWDSTPR